MDQVFRDMRVRSLYSPYYFVKVVLGYDGLVDHFHNVLLELFVTRWSEGCWKQAIEMFRGSFKTSTFTIGTSIWVTCPVTEEDTAYAVDQLKIPLEEWIKRTALHNQDVTQLLAFETQANAEKKILEIKHHYEENEIFRALFPEIAYQGTESPWNSKCLKIRRVGFAQRANEGTFEAIGVDGALQSRHYDIVWEDDLVGKAATESTATMLSTIRWHGLLSGAFVNAAKQTRFLISNRWGYEDLNGYVRRNEPDFVFHTVSSYELDPETGQERATFPERYSLEALVRIRDSGSMSRYDFSCQYQNSPILPGEREIDLDKMHTYTVGEQGLIICSCGSSFYPSQLLRWMHYDPYNAKGVRSTSCPGVGVVGTSVDKHVVLLDYWTFKGSYAKVFDKIFEFNDRWVPHMFTYEDVGNQNMAEFYIKQTQARPDFKRRKMPSIRPIPTRGKAKEIRLRDYLFPVFSGEGGRRFTYRKNQLLFTQQLESWPMASLEHDYDLLDLLAQGAQVWHFPLTDEEKAQHRHSDDQGLAQLNRPYSHVIEDVA